MDENYFIMNEGHGEIAMDLHAWWCKPYMPCMLPFLELPNMTIPKKNLDVLIGYWVRISNP
jgi:hypothetical protein